ncbi:putative protein-serine/threonine kinase CMGC-RCK family [Rosa chinensis]|uniref:Protein kinase domain-containing protein n=1 Tax=Rosa chinensis TaxID=74649 RepID=A0A2P6P9V8_ROSCH|nr:putative protein-serine/threonine kinase CMGC-RCK family [Rosa chinensis]
MEQYKFIKQVGAGSFGRVYKAIDKTTGEFVAIKELKHLCKSSYLQLPEVQALTKLKHPNIVNLKGVQRQHGVVFFIFEYMQGSLSQLIHLKQSAGQLFSEAEIRAMCFQVFQGLVFMHDQHGYIHRDLKPDNLLVNQGVIKISDLGAAREINSGPPFSDYITTRWYRAPEMLLDSFIYNEKVDMWAMGAIMAELFRMHPLFPGSSSPDQMYQICRVIGAPTRNTWREGCLLASHMNYEFPQIDSLGLRAVMPTWVSDSAVELIGSLCSWDPLKRPTAAQALHHPFFTGGYKDSASTNYSANNVGNVSCLQQPILV